MSPKLVSVLALVFVACTQHLPPPAPPARQPLKLPLPSAPPASGYGRVYIDAPEGPTNVDLVTGSGTKTDRFPLYVAGIVVMANATEPTESFRRICVTPCVADLPMGGHELKLTLRDHDGRTDRTVLVVSDPPTAVLHQVGRDEPHRRGRVLASIVLGLGIGLAITSPIVFLADKDTAGTGMLLSGLAIGGVGAFLMYLARPIKQPGASEQWPLP